MGPIRTRILLDTLPCWMSDPVLKMRQVDTNTMT